MSVASNSVIFDTELLAINRINNVFDDCRVIIKIIICNRSVFV